MSEQIAKVEALLQEVEDMVSNASRVPLTGKVLVDGDVVLQYVDKLHAALPDEVRQAQQIISQSEQLLESVNNKAETMLAEARTQSEKLLEESRAQAKALVEEANAYAKALVEESALYQETRRRCDELVANAQQTAMGLQQDALIYSDDVLAQLEANLAKVAAMIQQNRADLRK
ncbi:MAG: hypothetical protein IJF62_05375 [Firmicutes bacterium]|nr:hypothetical protein [Bacillota bacterium]MBQ6841932.1 hypothetical protein [Bacillota bacterium]MBR6823455.1 hypothetical protein [Bacillota bacterium]MBR7113180.1 hypothetical protein [Bacillota bacterium]